MANLEKAKLLGELIAELVNKQEEYLQVRSFAPYLEVSKREAEIAGLNNAIETLIKEVFPLGEKK